MIGARDLLDGSAARLAGGADAGHVDLQDASQERQRAQVGASDTLAETVDGPGIQAVQIGPISQPPPFTQVGGQQVVERLGGYASLCHRRTNSRTGEEKQRRTLDSIGQIADDDGMNTAALKTSTKPLPKIMGTTDEVTTCDCCFRQDLAKTVAIDFDGEVGYFGTTCAVAYLTANFVATTEKEVRTGARKADQAKREAETKARQVAFAAEFSRQQAKLDAMFPEVAGQRTQQMQRLRASGIAIQTI